MPPPATLLLLWALCASPSRAGSHSLRYFYSALSEGLPGAPQFSAIGYVDDEAIEAYSSASRLLEPRAPWMARVAESDSQYWERYTQAARGEEALRRADVRTVMGRNNQTTGLHTVQLMYGCELRYDGSIGGFHQHAYDGRDFLTLDLEHMKYTAAMEAATVTADRWNMEGTEARRRKAYLEQGCIEWLQKYLDYGKERLLRTVPPQVRISRRKSDTATTLTCYAYGFYPRDIEMNWVRNGVTMDWKTKVILPNTDGTYQIRTTVELPEGHDAQDYRCQVDHISLEDVITEVYKESGTWYIWLVVGVIAGVVVVALSAAVIWKRKHPDKGNNTVANQGVKLYTSVSNNGEAGPCSSPSNSFARKLIPTAQQDAAACKVNVLGPI